MWLDQTHTVLGWPTSDEIFSPHGVGARIYATLAREKIGQAIARRRDGLGVRVGVLASDPDATESPIAVVCNFPKKISEETLQETQQLAWNFGRTLLLITVEPHVIRTWTCCEPPSKALGNRFFDTPEIGNPIDVDSKTGGFLSEQAAASLHWVELLSGEFFRQNESRFKPEKRADQMLLSNLKDVRRRLIDAQLNDDTSHDLIARIIFIQFLFDRKDPEGNAALNEAELYRLHKEENILSRPYRNLGEILTSYEDTYALFRWLNGKFNGDLFPRLERGEEQDDAWAAERREVTADHLNILARFVIGQEEMKIGQRSLWPYYSFDAIPLEFISTIYEEFVKKVAKSGVHYTPAHVADLILDSVLPWNGEEWDLKILDPSCGSGVFLVKAFQRLIYRWKAAHPGERISSQVLIQLLENNLFGVDKDPHAVRVASFSLYLTMCDEIDPRNYWKDIHFPVMRGRRLIATDFFSEEHDGFRTADDPMYDLVIGNPPWGEDTAKNPSRIWQKENRWPISDGDIGPLFLAKALAITKLGGSIALLQPASTLLFKRTSPATAFREKLFPKVQIEEVINFSAFRHILFKDAVSPACAIVLSNNPPSDEPFWYSCPKPLHRQDDKFRIVLEPHDVQRVFPDEALELPWVWCTLLWGGRRDLALISKMNRHDNLAKLDEQKSLVPRVGIVRGDRKKKIPKLVGMPLLEARDFPVSQSLFVNAGALQKNSDPGVNSLHHTGLQAFELPQVIIGRSWIADEGRFRAALVHSSKDLGAILCSESYVSLHAPEENKEYLDGACLAYNSIVAVYYLLLTSGRFAMYRPAPETKALYGVPLPHTGAHILNGVVSIDQVDERAREVYAFNEAEWLLIDDLAQFTLPDFKGGAESPGRQRTRRQSTEDSVISEEPELVAYCETFRKVMHAAYGGNKHVGAIIYSEPTVTPPQTLPVRLVSFYLDVPEFASIRVEPMHSDLLKNRLTKLYLRMLSVEEDRHSFYQRTAQTYDVYPSASGECGIVINVIKPDRVRYWTRSMSLRDADAVAADLKVWEPTPDPAHRIQEMAIA